MCGIFAYQGKCQNGPQVVLEGLRLLEYRGYDSWGAAISEGGVLHLQKHIGKIAPSAQLKSYKSTSSIGHTRWATHGGVTIANAHPHISEGGEVAIVHNGIVENFELLKSGLLKDKHRFTSETDTEVIPHLIEEYLKKNGNDEEHFIKGVRYVFNKLKGLNAFVALYNKTGAIVAVKNGSPLVVGKAADGYYIASDVVGIIQHTKNVFFLEDDQMVVLAKGRDLQLLTASTGAMLTSHFSKLDWKYDTVTKGTFPHFLLKEIHEQPQVLYGLAATYKNSVKYFVSQIKQAYGTFMIGCGTASYAALYGSYIFSRVAKKHINATIGSEFNYLEDYITPKTLVVPISQSGETIDVVQPVAAAKKKGARIVAITNTLGSSLYRLADSSILLNAGVERAVVATKSFTAMVGTLLCAAYAVAGRADVARTLMLEAAEGAKQILSPSYIKDIKSLANTIAPHHHLYILGRGISYAGALESALKLKETAYVHAEGFAGGELKHGVIALIEKGTPCIILAPCDETYDEIISNAQEVKARGGYIIGISPVANNVFDAYIKIKDVKDASIILQVVVVQLLAYYLALKKGIKDPDKPRNLAKSVTVK